MAKKKGKENDPEKNAEDSIKMMQELFAQMGVNNLEDLEALLSKKGAAGKELDSAAFINKEKAYKLLDKAQGMNPGPARKQAMKALELDPLNADIYVFLGNNSDSAEEALTWYQKGIEAGVKEIGEKVFEESKGDFWRIFETRPYMRALNALSECLWEVGRFDESIESYWLMLELNPEDNQGVRYRLAPTLVFYDRFTEFEKLHKMFKEDDGAIWAFNYAFFLFKKDGPKQKATNALKKAHEANPHYIKFFTKELAVPIDLPEYYGIGDEKEAAFVFYETMNVVMFTPGMTLWMLEKLVKAK